jgi:hypothetical protein
MFSRGSTAARQRLLDQVDQAVRGVTYENFLPANPGVFLLSVDGNHFQLTRSQVESWVAGLRMGVALQGRTTVDAAALEKILTHQF